MSSVVTFDCVDAYYSGVARGKSDERERIVELLENPYWHNIQSPDIHIECQMCKTIELIKGEQK